MTIASSHRTRRIAGLALGLALLVPGIAGAVMLPDHAPIPVERPDRTALDNAAVPVVHRDVTRISTQAQDIPESRRGVRVVGTNFLPPREERIDFSAPTERELAVVSFAERLVMTAMIRLFERGETDEALQVASTDTPATN